MRLSLRRYTITLSLIAVVALPLSIRGEQKCDQPCRKHPRLAAPCFTARGRMNFANGAPSVRVWLVGTKRVVGVSEGKYHDPKYCNLPAEIVAKLSWDTDLFGDFVFCPFEHSQPGVMQLVCVDSGTNLVVRARSANAA